MMRVDTELKRVQIKTEFWKTLATAGGMVAAFMGAGAAIFASGMAFFKWYYGVN